MQTNTTTAVGSPAARPTLLTVLCILTFIATVLVIVFGGLFTGILTVVGGEGSAGALVVMIFALVLNIGALFGAIKMWKLQKVGFFIYTGCALVSQFIMPFVTDAALGTDTGINWVGAIISLVFVGLYYTNLKVMK